MMMFMIRSDTQTLLACAFMLIIHVFLMEPMVIDGLSPQGVDVVASKGESHQARQYKARTGENPLWNPYLFSGMPRYMRMGPQTPSIDTFVNYVGIPFGNMFVWYLVGSLGFFFFMRYMGLSVLSSMAGALAFTLLPHYQSLWIEGHNVKFRAVMVIPWVAFSARYFFDSRSLLSAALFALAFGNQIRTQHYQVIFYTSILVFAMGIVPLSRDLINRKWRRFSKSTGLLFSSIAFALMLAAQPLFLAGEYLPFSARGTYTIDLTKSLNSVKKSDGLNFQSATQWSTHPSALVSWVIPRFEGGMSSEIYKGDNYPRLKGRSVPGYWGNMPFTQSYEFFGPVVLLLALLGFLQNRKNALFISLGLCGLYFVLLSFGRHLESFYTIFFNHLPYFKNFRAPMMSITVTGFIVCFFTAFGFENVKKNISLDHKNTVFIISGILIAVGVLTWLGASQFSFEKPGEQYSTEIKAMILSIRREFLMDDVFRYLIILGISIGLVIGAMMQKLSKFGAVIGLIALMGLDLISIQIRKPAKFVNMKRLERNHFQKTGTDDFLLKVPGYFRILPLGKLFGDNRWSYFHQSAGGYSAIKMNRMEEIIKNSLFLGSGETSGLNLNVLKILNVHYVVGTGTFNHPNFKPVYQDPKTGWQTFQFTEKLPRGYFVGKTETIEDAVERLRRINSNTFNPVELAILESDLEEKISIPSQSKAVNTAFSPDQIDWQVSTNEQSLLVLSETPYSPGWKAKLDGNDVKLLTANHVNMAIVVPEGEHTVRLIFHPDSYYLYSSIETIAAIVLYTTILGVLYWRRNNFFFYKKNSMA